MIADDDDVVNVVKGLSATTKAALKRSQKARMRMSKGGGIKSTGSTVYFHRYETFGALRDKDWYLTLPDGERALGCACGEGWAAVMTRCGICVVIKRLVRIFIPISLFFLRRPAAVDFFVSFLLEETKTRFFGSPENQLLWLAMVVFSLSSITRVSH